MSNFITDGVRLSSLEESLANAELARESAPRDPDILAAIEHLKKAIATTKSQLTKSSKGFVTP